MYREGVISVFIPAKRFSDLDIHKNHKYNRVIVTNNTVKKPYRCPSGRRNCCMCSRPEISGKRRRLVRINELRLFQKTDELS